MEDIKPAVTRGEQSLESTFDFTSTGSTEAIWTPILERLVISNLKSIEAYIAHHSTNRGTEAIHENSQMSLWKITSSNNDGPSFQAARLGMAVQAPGTQEPLSDCIREGFPPRSSRNC